MPEQKEGSITDRAIAESNAYEIIRNRLEKQGKSLEALTAALNAERLKEFQSAAMEVTGRLRVRTENNCVARDIVQVGDQLLFGYNVFIGLKKETRIDDVFTLYMLSEENNQFELKPVSLENTFLTDRSFAADFKELYAYYKHARLIQLMVRNGKLLAAFQIGERISDLRVFRWEIMPSGELTYIDNRGERDIALPESNDFEWLTAGRDFAVQGPHPHLNILDTLFVETIGGDLTVKVENNTNTGLGIFQEEVDDKTQALDDAKIFFAEVGQLILLKILPYREEVWRYLVFNRITQKVDRIDEIGQSCIQLPEDHGVIFPGGIYLQNGEIRRFDSDVSDMRFKRMIRSPNGEDVLYVFYEPIAGMSALFSYNLIEKSLTNPIFGHGYAIAANGQMVLFSSDSDEATRIHPMQIWQTPFVSDEYASQQPPGDSFYARIGNAELVRGISDLYSVIRSVQKTEVSMTHYDQLIKDSNRLFEAYYWFDSPELTEIKQVVSEISSTSDKVLDEFEKVESIRLQAVTAMQEAEAEQKEILKSIRADSWEQTEEFVEALNRVRHQRGHLMTVREYRYIDQDRIAELEAELLETQESLGSDTVHFLASDQALVPYREKLTVITDELEQADTVVKLEAVLETQSKIAGDLDVLSELMSSLKVDDATVRIRVVDDISEIYAKLNQSRARTQHKKKDIGKSEATAQFGVQFKLFSQSVTNALSLATTPDKCDEQLSRLLVQIEELESQFSDHDEFLTDIITKREEVYESFEAHKQTLVNERQRRAQNLMDAAGRIITSIQRRTAKFTEMDELNTFYAADPLVIKVRDIADQLRELDDSVKADDLESNLKGHKEQAIRGLRDKQDIYEDGGNVIKLGPTHRFSVTTQDLDLTLLPRGDHQFVHLSGTDFFEQLDAPELESLRDYWEQNLESETPDFYRAEYLAGQLFDAIENHEIEVGDDLLKTVRDFAAPRYKEGYEKGIHDHDAALILKQLLATKANAGLLRFNPMARGIALLFWDEVQQQEQAATWPNRALSATEMRRVFSDNTALGQLTEEVKINLAAFVKSAGLASIFESSASLDGSDASPNESEVAINEAGTALDSNDVLLEQSANYLVEELSLPTLKFSFSAYGEDLTQDLMRSLETVHSKPSFQAALDSLKGKTGQRWQFINAWLQALMSSKNDSLKHYIPEAIALISLEDRLPNTVVKAQLEMRITELLGDHPLIQSENNERFLSLSFDEFLTRYQYHKQTVVTRYQRYLHLRNSIIEEQRKAFRLETYKPRPLSSFVRNKLLNESYLPLIGDNLAKQMGTVGEDKRTDLMGLLMLISPPGYGKTTLMEYVASRLGLIFMKINCPSLGHHVVSLDPTQAPDSTAAQELDKINLALEMSNNVMLYLDDIQHTHPEFLQKFISLTDGTRRIDGVWKGDTKTYDMRGKRFCIIMAGNPYTESGEVFKVPDMLANRADIYNLGEVLGDKQDIFALSYLENSLTANKVLAPLATREMSDIYTLIDMAKGREVSTSDLSHSYGSAELNEINDVFKKLLTVQEVVLKVNQQYIASAAQNDEYRTEPSFKLQGSYRNMNKMVEKVSAAMNDDELMQMIEDHYQGEAQLLTGGAEENLLKLAELRGNMTEAEAVRWAEIKETFQNTNMTKNAEVEIGLRIADRLGEISTAFQHSDEVLAKGQVQLQTVVKHVVKQLHQIGTSITQSGESPAITQQMEQISQGLGSLNKGLNKTLDKPSIEAVLLPQLSTISDQLQQLNSGKSGTDNQAEVTEQLKAITLGVQHMGQELSEVSETAKQRLNWLKNIKSKAQKKIADE